MDTIVIALYGALAGLILFTIYIVFVSRAAIKDSNAKRVLAEENNEELLYKFVQTSLRNEALLAELKNSQSAHTELWAETTLERKDYQIWAKQQYDEISDLYNQIRGLNGLIEMLLTDIHPAIVEFRAERAEERQPALFALPSGA